MPGISKRNIDDIHIHLKQIISADEARKLPRLGETVAAARARHSGVLPLATRALVESVLIEVREHAPGMGGAQTAKFSTSRAARDAVALGKRALARVDSHLQAMTRQREPLVGRNYGVYGPNPTSMAGVAAALFQSQIENARIKALPAIQEGEAQSSEAVAERALVFTPVVEAAVDESLAALEMLVGGRLSTRAELSRRISLKGELIERAIACITAVRNHLYANLPQRLRDPDLRDYGFRPVHRRVAAAQTTSEAPPNVLPAVVAASVASSSPSAADGPVSIR